ncbi:hypothetical protein MESS2_1000006 [Mesorhizobium metallidurans STM 2683]|uniref:Uncharacterized protein n=3 Tax=Mesorhizobium TaxID=68287 RepID=A0A2P9AU49_9HYPH|nr:conserved hypothetical protein [Mesorhizobium escarrei]CCV02992.1 hypothetical protein MESS2_1000006 [Mesorhizobium metallidurans STM 2683]SJM34689.1 conserved hypothetical protein [Mesorhizobium delmotii]
MVKWHRGTRRLAVPGAARETDAADPSDRRRDSKSANTVKGPGRHTLRHSFATPEDGAYLGLTQVLLGTQARHAAVYASSRPADMPLAVRSRSWPFQGGGEFARRVSVRHLDRDRRYFPCCRPAYQVAHAGQFSLGS